MFCLKQNSFFVFSVLNMFVLCTIDLNLEELEYLSNHLLPEECRRLVAAAHFQTYLEENALIDAELKMPKDVSCIELLLHWNSIEGRGETHEILVQRLREMGKNELAEWLGKTAFHQLGKDLDDSLLHGLKELANETLSTKKETFLPTLLPPLDNEGVQWTPLDTICYLAIVCLIVVIIFICCKIIFVNIKKKKTRKNSYEMLRNDSSSESEEKFDIRKNESNPEHFL